MIYLDNAATSLPKAPGVADAMVAALEGGSPGRGAHAPALAAGRTLWSVRRRAARLFGAEPDRVVLTSGATQALNLAIGGVLTPGDHVVASDLDHNAVLRPLYAARERGVAVTLVRSERGLVSPEAVASALRPDTALVVLPHASNVLGTVQPVAAIAAICRERGVPVLLDAAQTAGLLPLDLATLGVQALAIGGHKGLLGPAGTGLLVLAPGFAPRPTSFGGTGTDSASETMPAELPEALEPGTPNTPGLAGLDAALAFVAEQTPQALGEAALDRARRLRSGLEALSCWRSPAVDGWGVPVVSGTVLGPDGRPLDPAEVADALWERGGIAARAGFHCAPLAHRAVGAPSGLLRFSPGHATTDAEVDATVEAVRAVAEAS